MNNINCKKQIKKTFICVPLKDFLSILDHFTHRAYNHIGFGYSSLFNRQTINPGGVLVGGGPVMAPQEQNSVRSLTQWGKKAQFCHHDGGSFLSLPH